jgi:hypothetical protein
MTAVIAVAATKSFGRDLYRNTNKHCTLTVNRRRQKPFSGDKDAG